ncbi:MAG: hypothetical protein PHW31_00330 [Candidatus Pacebacteria bacterium]|nr:hypothetical protein [Candidatus Paceibacterota bacterium]
MSEEEKQEREILLKKLEDWMGRKVELTAEETLELLKIPEIRMGSSLFSACTA